MTGNPHTVVHAYGMGFYHGYGRIAYSADAMSQSEITAWAHKEGYAKGHADGVQEALKDDETRWELGG